MTKEISNLTPYKCECENERFTININRITCVSCGNVYSVSGLPTPNNFNLKRKQIKVIPKNKLKEVK